jgi:hypothetical protein
MIEFITSHALIFLIGAGIFGGIGLYLVDHFKTYVLDGSRDPVRLTSLRYVQIFSGFVTICLLLLILALIGLASQLPAQLAGNQGSNPNTTSSTLSAGEGTLAPGETPGGVTATSAPEPSPTLNLPPSPTPAVMATIANTGGAGANMRSIPGMEGVIITSVNEGTEVTVLGQTETMDGFTWQLIVIPDGRQGWVVSNYLIFQR